MKGIFILLTWAFLTSSCLGQSQSDALTTKNNTSLSQEIDAYIEAIRKDYGVPGIALAIIHQGETIHQHSYGYASIEHEVPITEESIFRLYSLTKLFVAVGIFHLIENEKISLENKLSQYIESLPEEWQDVQIKHLLTHSSGLPDMAGSHPYDVRELTEEEAIDRVFAMPISFQKGARFAYNQTNFWLLKELIETITKTSLSDFITENQFPQASEKNVFFSADSRDIVKHRVTPYFPFAKGELIIDLPYVTGDYLYAANGMNITLREFMEWDKMLTQNRFISEMSKQNMWELFPYTQSESLFAYGWGIYDFDQRRGYGFSGSMSTMYLTFPEEEISVIFLSNGFSSRYNMGTMINEIVTLILE